jgi:hypothetical protein
MLASLIVVYDMTSAGRGVSAFALRPSFRRCLERGLLARRSAVDISGRIRGNVPADVYPLVAPGVL